MLRVEAKRRGLGVSSRTRPRGLEYRQLTGKPLGITGEVAEYEAARCLGVRLTPARQAGYDATETRDGTERKLQIKGRWLFDDSKPGQHLGSIRLTHAWDAVLMVLLDQNFDATEIWEAERPDVEAALTAPGSKARNERGALDVRRFKRIGCLRWPLGQTAGSARDAPERTSEPVTRDAASAH